MSEPIIPEEVKEVLSDVAEKVEDEVEAAKEKIEDAVEAIGDTAESIGDKVEEEFKEFKESDLAEKTLAELSEIFEKIKSGANAMARSKEAEAVKSAFYKLLTKLKGENPDVSEEDSRNNPFEQVEENFKALYADYKKERNEFNRQQDAIREDNLKKKQQVVEDLKALLETQEDVNATFPAFREIQNRWREIGPVPVNSYRDINDSYQFCVEKFYDMVKINRDLRDLDFKKNLEAKQAFCEAAEKLAENENVVNAFHELQKLHEQWKEFGPVAKEYREDIWNRFKAATAAVNKRYQAHFEDLKVQQADNLVKKTALCEKLEEIAAKADGNIKSSSEWNALTKEIEDIQAQWKKIGFASKKENQKIYDRFRASCDSFFEKKRAYYAEYKDGMNANLEKKLAIVAEAEELKSSKEWKSTSDKFIELQKRWKEIGAVPRKKSEQLWKKFRAACDEFFDERDKNGGKPENDFYGNLKLKKKIIEEIKAFEIKEDEAENIAAMHDFQDRFGAIGFVPFKEKDNIAAAYKEAMQEKFPSFSERRQAGRRQESKPKSVKDTLVQKYNALQQDIVTYENNIGFFSTSKNSAPLLEQMKQRIEDAKKELKELEEKIRKAEEAAAEE